MGETYDGLTLTFADRDDWVLGTVLERRAVTHRDRPCLQWEDGPALTYDEVNRTVNRWAHGLSRTGIAHGDRVMLFLPNCLEYLFAWFALNKLGAIQVPVNTNYRGSFLDHVANNCAARVAIVDAEFLPQFERSEDAMPKLETLYVRGRSTEASTFRRIVLRDIAQIETDNEANPGIAVGYRDIAAILFTSGTTGPSKGVLMPHAQLYFFAEEGANVVRLTDADIYMTGFPLFHGNAQFLTIYPSLIRGAHAALYEAFSATEWIDRVRRTGTTVTNLLGVTMDFVFKQPPRPDDADTRLRAIYAAPPAVSIMDDFKRRFRVQTFVNGFGQTEACLPLLTPYEGDRPPEAVGKVVAEWFDVRLVDPETDEEVPIGTMGELLVRPKVPWLVCAGYNGQPEATLKTMRNLWWHTGDGMWRDEAGWFYFVDRVNDALRVRGENVSSYEVEQVILSHPAVTDCAVVSVRSEVEGGEHEIKACVVLAPGATLSGEELVRFCEARMPFFAVPRYVEYLDELPKTPSAKIQKYLLRKSGVAPSTWDRVKAGVVLEHHAARRSRRERRA